MAALVLIPGHWGLEVARICQAIAACMSDQGRVESACRCCKDLMTPRQQQAQPDIVWDSTKPCENEGADSPLLRSHSGVQLC